MSPSCKCSLSPGLDAQTREGQLEAIGHTASPGAGGLAELVSEQQARGPLSDNSLRLQNLPPA